MENPKSKVLIESRADADAALARIAALTRRLEIEERIADQAVRDTRETLVKNTAELRAKLEAEEAALKAWAKGDAKTWPAKSLELNFGTVGFRRPPAAIKFKLAIETIVERLRAKRMQSCIRTVEEPDKEALAAYDDETISGLGCERTKPKDKFWYELKREEVKG